MKKIINNRFLLFIVIIFICGLLIGYSILTANLLMTIILSVVVILFTVLLILNYRKIIIIVLSVICLFIGLSSFFTQWLYINSYNKDYGSVTLTGRISIDSYTTYTNQAYALLDNVSIISGNETTKLNGKVRFQTQLSTLQIEAFNAGSIITLDCNLNGINIFADGIDSYLYRNSVFWEISSYSKSIIFTEGNLNLSEKCTLYIKNILYTNLDSDSAALAQGLLLGDKSQLSYSTRQTYRNLGIAHLFAVSGLHIGFIVLVISFILNKLKIKRWPALVITMIPIIIYAYICNFSPSIMRAGLMCFIGLLASCFYRDIDVLSRMSFAIIIILMIRPLYLFDAAFLLSFASVFGIATLSSSINSYCKSKNKLSKISWLTSPSALSIGATAATLPFVAYFYGQVSILGVFINLLVIPIITVVFIMLLIGLIPFMNFIFVAANFVLSTLNQLLIRIEINTVPTVAINDIGYGLIFVIAILFVIGGYVNLRKIRKVIISVSLIIVCVIVSVINSIPFKTNYSMIYYNGIYAFTDKDGYMCVLTNLENDRAVTLINDYKLKYRINTIDLIVFDYTAVTLEAVIALNVSGININMIFVYNTTLNNIADTALKSMGYEVIILKPNTSNLASIEITSIYDSRTFSAVTVKIDNFNVFIPITDNVATLNELTAFALSADIVISNSEIFDSITDGGIIISNNMFWNQPLNIKQLGNFSVSFNNDKLILNRI